MQLPDRRILVGMGIFLLLGILLLTYFVFKIEGMSLKRCTPYRLYFSDITGIPERSEVRVRGVVVGRVQGFHLSGDQVEVRICLTEPVIVRQEAMAVVRPKSLLGERFVDLRPGTTGPVLPPDSIIVETLNPVRVEDLGEILYPLIKGINFSDLGKSLRVMADFFAKHPTQLAETFAAAQRTLVVLEQLLAENRTEIHTLIASLARFSHLLSESKLSPEEVTNLLKLLHQSLSELTRFLNELKGLSQENPQLVHDLIASLSLLRKTLERLSQLDPHHFLLVLKKIIQEEGITVNIFGYSEEQLKNQLKGYGVKPSPTDSQETIP